jgi:uncharacterized DUF497 family protein
LYESRVVKKFDWDEEKNNSLRETRKVCFEEIVVAIENGGLLSLVEHPNQRKYSSQKIGIVALNEYVYLVSFSEEPTFYFLKTIIPSRKATRDYLDGN